MLTGGNSLSRRDYQRFGRFVLLLARNLFLLSATLRQRRWSHGSTFEPQSGCFADGHHRIEDAAMVTQDEDGNALASYKFVDRYTIRAHPLIVDALLEDEETEQVWTMNQILSSLE